MFLRSPAPVSGGAYKRTVSSCDAPVHSSSTITTTGASTRASGKCRQHSDRRWPPESQHRSGLRRLPKPLEYNNQHTLDLSESCPVRSDHLTVSRVGLEQASQAVHQTRTQRIRAWSAIYSRVVVKRPKGSNWKTTRHRSGINSLF